MTFFALLLAQTGLAALDANFEATHFSGSGNCIRCHDGLIDPVQGDVSIVSNWSASMMANAATDPYWRAKVASELHRNAGLADEINERCSRCHAPMANDAMAKDGAEIAILGGGMLDPGNDYFDHALEGVSCTACHQISDDGNLGTLAGFSGNFTIAQHGSAVERPIYGQYIDPRIEPMQNAVGFLPQFGAHMSDAALCATCHNLKTPFVDSQGNLASTTPETEFPEQMVYSEWLASAFSQGASARTCQDCHMLVLDSPIAIATRPRNLAARAGFAQHTFLGANTAMLDILASNRVELGVAAADFEKSIADTRALLRTSASLELVTGDYSGTVLEAVLRVRNLIGHKFPTSYPSRRAFIHVTVADANGRIVFESGRLNPDGSIVGNVGDEDSGRYEPHYDRITAPDEVQIYEPIMVDTDGAVTHTLLRAARYVKDNRITPAGFDKHRVSSDVAVHGAASDDVDFNLGEDLITYAVDLTGVEGPVVFTAELQYQSLAFGHLQDLFVDSAAIAEVATFQRLFEGRNVLSEDIASVSVEFDAASGSSALTDTDTDTDTDTGDGIAGGSDTGSESSDVDAGDSVMAQSGSGRITLWILLVLLSGRLFRKCGS